MTSRIKGRRGGRGKSQGPFRSVRRENPLSLYVEEDSKSEGKRRSKSKGKGKAKTPAANDSEDDDDFLSI